MPEKSKAYWLVYMMDNQCYQLNENEVSILVEAIKRQGKGLVIFKRCVISIASISSMERKIDRVDTAPLLPALSDRQKEEKIESEKKVNRALKELGRGGRASS